MSPIRFGIFNVEDCWKLYADGGGETRTFLDRDAAVAAGAQAAREAMARGQPVELHLQEATGEFRQADLVALAH